MHVFPQNSILADPRTNRTGQLRLQSRLKIRSHVHNLRFKCKPCEVVRVKKRQRKLAREEKNTVDDSDVEQGRQSGEVVVERDNDEESEKEGDEDDDWIKGEGSSHCHCHLFRVDDELMASMTGGQPYRRFNEDKKKKRREKVENDKIREHAKKSDDEKYKTDMKIEVQRLRRKLREDAK